MKKLFLLVLFILTISIGYAQETEKIGSVGRSVGRGADSKNINRTINHTNYLIENPNAGATSSNRLFNILDYGGIGDSLTDDSQAWQDAADAAYMFNGDIFAPALPYRIETGITIRSGMFASGARLYANDSTIEIITFKDIVGQSITKKTLEFPFVYNEMAPSAGRWPGSSVGIKLINSYANRIYIPGTQDFVYGVHWDSQGSSGSAHNIATYGDLRRSKIGLWLSPSYDGGYTNSNMHIGGRITEYPGYEDIAGHHGIVIDTSSYPSDNNAFHSFSMDGDSWEYQVLVGGVMNSFYDMRLEPSEPSSYPAKVHANSDITSGIDGNYNNWDKGFNTRLIEFSGEISSVVWNVDGNRVAMQRLRDPKVMSSEIATDKEVLVFVRPDWAGTLIEDGIDDYGVGIGYDGIGFKQNIHDAPLLKIYAADGSLRFGNGTDVYDTRIYRGTTATVRIEDDLIIDNDLFVTRAIVQNEETGGLADGAPTEADIDAATGRSAAGAGAGYTVLILDTSGAGGYYLVISNGSNWEWIQFADSL